MIEGDFMTNNICSLNEWKRFVTESVLDSGHQNNRITESIDQENRVLSYKKEIALAQQAVEMAEIYHDRLFIVCNNSQIIIAASKRVREKIPHVTGMKLEDFLSNGYPLPIGISIFSKEDNSLLGRYFLFTEGAFADLPVYSGTKHLKELVFHGERGISKIFSDTLNQVNLVSASDTTVYLTGETGTGKELIARAIHENSPRKNGPFISLNCGAIPKELIESELFGYVEGAFTGAKRKGYKGKFQQAHNGTIFLDEIGEIPHSMQVALLRVLQERKVLPIGSTKEIPIDVRVITATHCDLSELVKAGRIRKDLYYRIDVFPIKVPPLRERVEDIPYLINFLCQRHSWSIPFQNEWIPKLNNYPWPGNIRELMNLLERLHIMFSDEQLDKHEIMKLLHSYYQNQPVSGSKQGNLEELNRPMNSREQIQRELMLTALQKTKGNVTAAAKLLEIPRSTFYKRLQKFGL